MYKMNEVCLGIFLGCMLVFLTIGCNKTGAKVDTAKDLKSTAPQATVTNIYNTDGVCTVCGKHVKVMEYGKRKDGSSVFVCSDQCMRTFSMNPQKYGGAIKPSTSQDVPIDQYHPTGH